MRYQITHHTRYRYETPVTASYSEARLLPRNDGHQACVFSELVIDPAPADQRERTDHFGNRTVYFAIDRPHDELHVRAVSEVEVRAAEHRPDHWSDLAWQAARDRLRAELTTEALTARQFTLDSPFVTTPPELARYAAPSFPPGRPLVEAVIDLNHRIHQDFDYQPGATTTATSVAEVLERRAGVCQDFAHLAIGCVRSMGLAARYVSGYLETDPPPGQERLLGADASHAWLSVYVPGDGWLELDPTNAQIPNQRYVVTAWGRDYGDVTPIKGVVFSAGGTHELAVAVDVVRLGV